MKNNFHLTKIIVGLTIVQYALNIWNEVFGTSTVSAFPSS